MVNGHMLLVITKELSECFLHESSMHGIEAAVDSSKNKKARQVIMETQ